MLGGGWVLYTLGVIGIWLGTYMCRIRILVIGYIGLILGFVILGISFCLLGGGLCGIGIYPHCVLGLGWFLWIVLPLVCDRGYSSLFVS